MAATTGPLLALTASDLMSPDVVTISQDAPLRAAAELFFQRQVGEAAVVDADGRCVGVLSATGLMVHKLLSFSQHYCDFARGLPLARSLREQIDWERVRKETQHSPYAEAFLVLLDRLDVVPYSDTTGGKGTP